MLNLAKTSSKLYSILETAKDYSIIATQHGSSEIQCIMYCERRNSIASFQINICQCLKETDNSSKIAKKVHRKVEKGKLTIKKCGDVAI